MFTYFRYHFYEKNCHFISLCINFTTSIKFTVVNLILVENLGFSVKYEIMYKHKTCIIHLLRN